MLATHIQTLIMLPGAKVEKRIGDIVALADLGLLLEDCCILYSVEQNKITDIEDVATDLEGKLRETIFGIVSMQDIGENAYPPSSYWITEWFTEGSWESLQECNLKALYEVARGKIYPRIDQPDLIMDISSREKLAKDSPYFQVEFIACWTYETSTEWETGFTEVDTVDFECEGKVVKVEEKLLTGPGKPVLQK
jgi:hypothetical protein